MKGSLTGEGNIKLTYRSGKVNAMQIVRRTRRTYTARRDWARECLSGCKGFAMYSTIMATKVAKETTHDSTSIISSGDGIDTVGRVKIDMVRPNKIKGNNACRLCEGKGSDNRGGGR